MGISIGSQVWMSHSDTIKTLPTNGVLLASTHDVEHAAYKIEGETTYAIQFHPEVYHSTDGKQLLQNFLVDIAGLEQDWTQSCFRAFWWCRFNCCSYFIEQSNRR
jgi:GMP synthase (glutamine-hydrolysing)